MKLKKLDNKQTEIKIPEFMEVAYLTEPLKVKVGEHETPKVGSRDVLVQIKAVGICGSDVHYYVHGHIGERKVQYPHIQGHECAGIVVATGDKVSKFNVGDRVAIEPSVSCMACEWCKEGRYNLCPDMQFLSTPPVKGAFAQYLSHREDFLYTIPNSLSYEIATLAEPLSVGIYAVKRGNIKPNSTVLITGMGPVGLMTIIAAKEFGAKEIIVSDTEPNRLNVAKKLGATEAVNISNNDLGSIIKEVTAGQGTDVVIETSGNEIALESSVKLTKRGGTIVAVGFPTNDNVSLNMTYILQNEIDIISVYRYVNAYPTAIELLNQSRTIIENVITDKLPMREIQKAMKIANKNKENSIKVIVYPNN